MIKPHNISIYTPNYCVRFAVPTDRIYLKYIVVINREIIMSNLTLNARREFLRKITVCATGTASMVVAASSIAQTQTPSIIETESEPVNPPQSKGYQRSEHVDTYYKLADF